MNKNTLIPNTPTTIGSWALLIAKAIQSYGLNAEDIFTLAELDLEVIKNNPNIRLPVNKMATLWAIAVKQTQDEAFALRLNQFFQPSTYSATGIVIASCKTIMEGFQYSLKYFQLTTDAALHRLDIQDDTVTLLITIPPENEPVAVEAVEAFMSTLVSLSRAMMSEDFSPIAVSFKHDKSHIAAKYQAFFGCQVAFNQAEHKIIFSRADVEKPQMLANPILVATLKEWAEEYLQRYNEDLISVKVKAYILENMLKELIELENIASAFNMGLRTLQRRLKAEGCSYNDLLDECRHHMALKLIADKRFPLAEVGYLLGFSDQSGFTRAFKRWTQKSPKQYRDSLGLIH